MLTLPERKKIMAQTQLAVRDCGGQEACAEASGRINRHQSFSEYANPNMPDRVIPLDAAAELDRFSGQPRFAGLLAELAGGVFVPLPRSKGRWALELAAARTTKEVGEAMSKLGAALEDGKFDRRERAEVKAELNDVLVAVHQLMLEVDGGEGGE